MRFNTMDKTILGIGLAVLILAGSGYYVLFGQNAQNKNNEFVPENNNQTTSGQNQPEVSAPPAQAQNNTPPPLAPTPNPTPTGFSMSEISKKNNAGECWSVVDGKVYNLTSWISKHPGGSSAILSICGRDGTSAFNDQHLGQEKVAQILSSFYLGPLR